jgi:hypothetical protein
MAIDLSFVSEIFCGEKNGDCDYGEIDRNQRKRGKYLD